MMNRRIVISTGNVNKVMEIKEILSELPIEICSKNELGLKNLNVEEDGVTLEENAIKKALTIAEKVDGIVIADDTGLFVNALDGRPGVHSSRYSGENATYQENNEKLLKELDGLSLEERSATFNTVMAIVTEDKQLKCVYGKCSGKIGFEPRGKDGFGYDPLFIVDGYGKTFAELGEDVKNKISHRARALEELKKEIIKLLEDDTCENIRGK